MQIHREIDFIFRPTLLKILIEDSTDLITIKRIFNHINTNGLDNNEVKIVNRLKYLLDI